METNCLKTKRIIPSITYWLIVQKWLWKKVVFDNGVAGKQYHRYDHRILPYAEGMGNHGEGGDLNTAIHNTITLELRRLNKLNN